MDELSSYRREHAARLLLPLFFLSGATGLVYQTLWARQLQLVFGTSQFAIATVLSAFMAGLAAGGLLMARHADRVGRPLRLYGLLEVGVGLYALLFPTLLAATEPLYTAFYRQAHPGPVLYGLAQFGLLGALLLLPTTFMGATLPLLGRFVTLRLGAAGDRVGLLYGVNTAGAVLGVGAAGFWLLPALGLWHTTVLAAVGNLLLGALALALSRQAEDGQAPELEQDLAASAPTPRAAMALGALAGFAALVCEVAWFRLMGLVLGGSTYAFSVMLLAFLSGIALGGRLGGPWADRALREGGPGGPLRGLVALQIGVGALTWGMMYLYPELPFWFVWLYDQVGQHLGLLWPSKLLLAALVMFPPALLMGATFPFLVRAAVGGEDQALGRPVGLVYGANTLGSIVGSFAGGFVLLPALNVIGAVLVAVGANLAGAALALAAARQVEGRSARGAAPLALALAGSWCVVALRPPPWDPLWMTAGLYKYVSEFSDHSREGIRAFAVEEYDLLYYDEGLSTVVTVAQSKVSGNIWLANNGKVDASTTVDMPTQVLVAHLPFLFTEAPQDVAVIGLASGITLGAATLHPEPRRIDAIELEPAIVQAARFFDDHNHRPLEDPRVRLVANDGRNQLVLTPPGTYDLVISEPSNPWLTGVSNLFTREFFELGRSRLKPGGVWSQWVQLYGMAPEDLRALLGTFSTVFPHVLVFATIEDADLVLVGSEAPLEMGAAAAERLLAKPAVRAELALIGVQDSYGLFTFYQFDQDSIAELAAGVGLNTDDNMRVEFSAPRQLHRDTSADNMRLLLPYARSANLHDDAQNLRLAQAYAAREEWLRALLCLQQLSAPLPEAEVLRPLYQLKLQEFLEGDGG